jgi:glutaconate CoA-transferase subunit B
MGETGTGYSDREMMAIIAGRLIRDGDILFAGTGFSMLAAAVAKRIHAPGAVIFFETGGVDPTLQELPMAVADSRVMAGAALNAGLTDAFSILGHRRLHTIAILGAAQVDRFGNLNTTCIGEYRKPKVRLPGSGGSCDAASLAAGFIIVMQMGKQRFVEKLDYMTSPGWLDGGDSRERTGYRRGGPIAVVTNCGVMKFHDGTKEMYLSEYYPGVSVSAILENMGFAIDVTEAVESKRPTGDELRILRKEVDPDRLILG